MPWLLDTHVLLWALTQPGRLPSERRETIATTPDTVYFSAINIWEIAIPTGRLSLVELSSAYWAGYGIPLAGLRPSVRDAGPDAGGTLPALCLVRVLGGPEGEWTLIREALQRGQLTGIEPA